MASTVPLVLLAKDIVSCTVYGGNASPTTGVITWSTGVDIASAAGVATFDRFSVRPVGEAVDVTPGDSPLRTRLTEVADFSGSLAALQPANSVGTLESVAGQYDFVKIVVLFRKRGQVSGGTYRAVVGRCADVEFGISAGRNVEVLSFDSCGISVYTGAGPLPSSFA